MKKITNLPLTILGILGIALILSFALSAYKSRIPKDWKLYENKEAGFRLKYPKDWLAETDTNGVGVQLTPPGPARDSGFYEEYIVFGRDISDGRREIHDFDELADWYLSFGREPRVIEKRIAGKKAYQFLDQGEEIDQFLGDQNNYLGHYDLFHKGALYDLSVANFIHQDSTVNPPQLNYDQNLIDTANRIVSTIKFTR